jgi:hypothetical protein
LGRDAAIGAGGVGLAAHEHNKHNQATTGIPTVSKTNTLGGPHQSNLMNKLDPRVNTNERDAQTTGHGPFKVDAATASGPPTTSGYTSNPAHHGITSTSNTGTQHNSHLGRDAGIAGGIGAAGYEADKSRHQKSDSAVASITNPDHPGHHLEHPRDTHQNVYDTQTGQTTGTEHTKDHHYGRDAAVAGGVGGAAYEAEKHHKRDKDLVAAEKEQKREHKQEIKEEKREKHDQKDHKSGGLFSFLRTFLQSSSHACFHGSYGTGANE